MRNFRDESQNSLDLKLQAKNNRKRNHLKDPDKSLGYFSFGNKAGERVLTTHGSSILFEESEYFRTDKNSKPSSTILFLMEQSKFKSFDEFGELISPKKALFPKQKYPNSQIFSSMDQMNSQRGEFFESSNKSWQKKPNGKLEKIKRHETSRLKGFSMFQKVDSKNEFNFVSQNTIVNSSAGQENFLASVSIKNLQETSRYLEEKPFNISKKERSFERHLKWLEEENERIRKELKRANRSLGKIIESQMESFAKEIENKKSDFDGVLEKNKKTIQKLKKEAKIVSQSLLEALEKFFRNEDEKPRETFKKERDDSLERKIDDYQKKRKLKLPKNQKISFFFGHKDLVFTKEHSKQRKKDKIMFSSQKISLEPEGNTIEVDMAQREIDLLLSEKQDLLRELKEMKIFVKKRRLLGKIKKIKIDMEPYLELEALLKAKNGLLEKIGQREFENIEGQKELQRLLNLFSGPVKILIKEAFDNVTLKQKEKTDKQEKDKRPMPEKQEKSLFSIKNPRIGHWKKPVLWKYPVWLEQFNINTETSKLRGKWKSEPTAFRFDKENPKD